MSEPTDPLEAELAGLQPRAPSPELRHRVAARLGVSRRRRWVWPVALVGVAALTVIVGLAIPRGKEPPPPVLPAVQPPPPPAAAEPESPAPSVLAYQRALARSPEAFDALLDRQSATNPGPVVTASFARSPAALDALIGDN